MYTGPSSKGMFPVFITLPVTVRGSAAVVVYVYSSWPVLVETETTVPTGTVPEV
jgi:hypothetical protein